MLTKDGCTAEASEPEDVSNAMTVACTQLSSHSQCAVRLEALNCVNIGLSFGFLLFCVNVFIMSFPKMEYNKLCLLQLL